MAIVTIGMMLPFGPAATYTIDQGSPLPTRVSYRFVWFASGMTGRWL